MMIIGSRKRFSFRAQDFRDGVKDKTLIERIKQARKYYRKADETLQEIKKMVPPESQIDWPGDDLILSPARSKE
ncbi:hypothetical protein B0F90DRAFT_1747279, partial [Multifurca ochricompacta]